MVMIGELVNDKKKKAISILFPNNPAEFQAKDFTNSIFMNSVSKLNTTVKEELVYLVSLIELNKKKEVKLLKAKDSFKQANCDINISPNTYNQKQIEAFVFSKMEEIKNESLPSKLNTNFINYDVISKCLT